MTDPAAVSTSDDRRRRCGGLPLHRAAIEPLTSIAIRGLRTMYVPERRTVVHTMRGVRAPGGVWMRPEGTNERYAAVVALGTGVLAEDLQRDILAGSTAAELARAVAQRASDHRDLGVLALAAWASAEVARQPRADLLGRLARQLSGDAPIPTVIAAWALTAALATDAMIPTDRGRTEAVIRWAGRRLCKAQSPHGIFPHLLPARLLGRWRAHVSCFADQVYPLQALARLAKAIGDAGALEAAERTAVQLCRLQGPIGQWWWHYDVRTGGVLEPYPVYSVHQHGMAPMALFDLAEAGGTPHPDAVARGLSWLDLHPEVPADLIPRRFPVVWRKVARREPGKAVRSLAAALTSLRPNARMPWRDRLFPPVSIDRECRPYELGWLLYAWRRPLIGSVWDPQ